MSNRTLFIVLIGLLLVYGISRITTRETRERTLPAELASVDTAAVTAVTLYPKSEPGEIRFERTPNGWTIRRGDVQGEADQMAVRQMLAQVQTFQPERLAATRPERWADFEVTDSLGTRIVVEENGRETLDLYIGRFSFRQNVQDAVSYVRLDEADEVYAVPGFLSMSFDRDFNSWRNRVVLDLDPETLSRLAFEYPADSSFTLVRQDTAWFLDDAPADSAAIAGYLNGLRSIIAPDIVDDTGVVPDTATFALTLTRLENTPLTVRAYTRENDGRYLLHSSQNPNVYFSSDSAGVISRIFAGPTAFR